MYLKNHKIKCIGWLFVFFLGGLLASCSQDDNVAAGNSLPEIYGLEVGIGNNHIAYVGSDLHIEAEIQANDLIRTVEIKIFKEDGNWELSQVYDEFTDQRNALFHKHIDISDQTEPGNYLLQFIVKDQSGNMAKQEVNIEIRLIEDNEFPVIQITSSPATGQLFTEGQLIEISGIISDNNSVHDLLVVLVKTEDNIDDEQVTVTNPDIIVLLNENHLENVDFYDFTENITVGAETDSVPKPVSWEPGQYYILVSAADIAGNRAFSEHLPVEINF